MHYTSALPPRYAFDDPCYACAPRSLNASLAGNLHAARAVLSMCGVDCVTRAQTDGVPGGQWCGLKTDISSDEPSYAVS